jgi:branched-chain amino acid transport system substrate-binding protein
MKRIVVSLALAALVLAALPAFAAGQKEEAGTMAAKSPVKVGAILAVTGGASFLGAPESKTLEMLVEETNAAGGIGGHPVELIIKDSQGSSEKAVSFAKQLIEEDGVLAIIGPSTSGESMAIKGIAQEGKTILLSCAAAETIVDPVASYVFKTPQKDSYAAIKIFQTMNVMHIKRIGVVVGNTGFGQGGRAQLEKYAPEHGIDIAIVEVYAKPPT